MELDEAQNRIKEQQAVIDRLTEEIDRLTEDVADQKALIGNLSKERSSAVRARSRGQGNGRSYCLKHGVIDRQTIIIILNLILNFNI